MHSPDYDGSEPAEPAYMSAGIPDAALMAQWVAAALAAHPAVLSALAQQTIAAFEATPAGSADEATLGLLSDCLHAALEGEEDQGWNTYASLEDEPARTSDAEDRYNRGGW